MTLKDAFDLTFKSKDYITKLWTIYVVITLAVVAWFADSNPPIACRQRIIASLFYVVFASFIYWLLHDAYQELAALASELVAVVETEKPKSERLTTYSNQALAKAEKKLRVMLPIYAGFSVLVLIYIVVLKGRWATFFSSTGCFF